MTPFLAIGAYRSIIWSVTLSVTLTAFSAFDPFLSLLFALIGGAISGNMSFFLTVVAGHVCGTTSIVVAVATTIFRVSGLVFSLFGAIP